MTSVSYQKHKNLSVANLYKIYKPVKQDAGIFVCFMMRLNEFW